MPVPLAMGERLYTIYQFQDLTESPGRCICAARPVLVLSQAKVLVVRRHHHVVLRTFGGVSV